jgi:ATP-dependent Clp protease protease subunit
MFYPNIIEKTGRSSRTFDLPTKLLQDRIIYFSGCVDEDSANYIIMQMLWLNADNPDEPINFYINSPGAEVYQGYAIKDTIDSLNCKVNTVGLGMCASMGAYLLAAGTGNRKAMKNCRIMLHSVSSGTYGNFHDMKIDFEETKYLQDKMLEDLASFTKGKTSLKKIIENTQRDNFLSPEEAIKMGLIDEVI